MTYLLFRKLYLVDYGLAKIFYNEKEGHIKNEVKMHVIGTTKYLSKNVLDLNTPSRRDDLISICYLLFELTTGKLPWSTRIMTEKYHKEFRGKTGQALKNAQKQKARELRECYTGLFYIIIHTCIFLLCLSKVVRSHESVKL